MYSSILSGCRIRTLRKTCFYRGLASTSKTRFSSLSRPILCLTSPSRTGLLFRHSPPEKPLLFLYRNTPCVVIGRNQNPWKEANMQALRTRDVPLVRRRSGGGTVYHDLGNTNFSIHLARRAFDRRVTSQLALRAVLALGVPRARLNDRNDICVGDDKMNPGSTSPGSAYKIVSARAYHHGTMLISTRLDALGDLLRVDKPTMVTAGVASVRSPVPHVEHDVFVNAVVDETDDPVCTLLHAPATALIPPQTQYQSWDWLYGQTPEFTYTIEQEFAWGSVTAQLRAKHGLILSCALHAPTAPPSVAHALERLGASAEGERYGSWPPLSNGAEIGKVTRWLAGMLN
ncbi:Lipoyltransferase and lipoate-protein ligase [Mycena olivaceomarginata]|nr:Lipoyltransferase and lipoate-protein ligase [Mycena olivaceomarginata]